MNETLKVLETRRSCRNFKPDMIKKEELDAILTAHPDAEFVQLQINYADWENPAIQSRGVYEVAPKLYALKEKLENAAYTVRSSIDRITLPEVRDFMRECVPSFGMTLDEISEGAQLE